MQRSIFALSALTALLVAAPADAKPESPGVALKRVVKQLKKLKSYRVNAHVKGGQAEGEKHTVPSPKVNENFNCVVKGKVAEINRKAFRWRFKGANGAIKKGRNWKAMLATEEGRLIGRLFLRPEEHLANALKYKKKAKWLAGQKTSAKDTGNLFEEEEGAQAEGAKGTRERKGTKKKSKARKPKFEITSNVIRVEAPAELAVQNFNTIVNSGCFSEG